MKVKIVAELGTIPSACLSIQIWGRGECRDVHSATAAQAPGLNP